MRILILSREPRSYSTRRLKEAARARGHHTRVVDTLDCTIAVAEGEPALYVVDKPVGKIDAVIPRIGASITFYGTAVLRQLEQMGVYTLNTAQAISVSRDKLRCLQVLSRHRVAIPKTAFVRSREDLVPVIEELGGPPLLVKLIEGVEGVGVIHAATMDTAYGVVETMQVARQNVLIQRPPPSSEEQVVRAFVIGGEVVAAMSIAMSRAKRTGRIRPVRFAAIELSDQARAAAERAAQIVGLKVAGIELAFDGEQVAVLDVSSSPDLEAIELVSEVDVAGAIVRHMEDEVAFPEVDIEQRLTLESGFGVAEFVVTPDANIVGQQLGELKLWERDVQVLSIVRGSVTLPNPRADVVIAAGDVVLCYGRLAEIRAIIPAQAPRRPRRSTRSKAKEQR